MILGKADCDNMKRQLKVIGWIAIGLVLSVQLMAQEKVDGLRFTYPNNHQINYLTDTTARQAVHSILYAFSWLNVAELHADHQNFQPFEGKLLNPETEVCLKINLFNTTNEPQERIFHLGDIEVQDIHLLFENGEYEVLSLPDSSELELPVNSFIFELPAKTAVNVLVIAQAVIGNMEVETIYNWNIRRKASQAIKQVSIGGVLFLLLIACLVMSRRSTNLPKHNS